MAECLPIQVIEAQIYIMVISAREARKYSPRLYGKVLSQNLGVVILKEDEERTLRDSSNFCHSRLGYLPALQVNHKFNG